MTAFVGSWQFGGVLILIVVWLAGWPSRALLAAAPITSAAIDPDNRFAVIGSQDGIQIRTWPDLEIVERLATDLPHVHDLAFSPDGQTLLAAGGSPAEEGAVEVWNWRDKTRLQAVSAHDDLVYRVAWSPDGKQWATASADGTCEVWAADTGDRLVRYEGHSRAVLVICFLPDGSTVISAGADQTVRIWNGVTGKHLRTLDQHVGIVNDVAVRPRRDVDPLPVIVSISEDRTVRLWQPTIGRLMRFARIPATPRSVIWSADGERVLVGCSDGRLRVIVAETAAVAGEYEGIPGRIHALAASRNDSHVLVAGETGVAHRLFDD